MVNPIVTNQLITTLTVLLMNLNERVFEKARASFKTHIPCNFGFDKVVLCSTQNAD